MGYPREIALLKRNDSLTFEPLKLIKSLEKLSWENKLELVTVGNEFDWVKLDNNITGQTKFEEIIREKNSLKEPISFALLNTNLNRSMTVFIEQNRVIFDLEIGRDDDEQKWFEAFHQTIVPPLLDKDIKEVTWFSGYENKAIRTFNT